VSRDLCLGRAIETSNGSGKSVRVDQNVGFDDLERSYTVYGGIICSPGQFNRDNSQAMSSVDGIMSGIPAEASSTAKDTMQPDSVNQEEATSLQPGQDTLMDIIETTDVQEDTELVDPDMEESAKSPQAAVIERVEVKDVIVLETATRAAAAPVSSAIPQDLEMIMNMVVDGGNVGGSGRASGDTQMAGTAEVESDR
jgi:hypothetical protein